MITVRVMLFRRDFHGLRDTGEPDWPPSPRRLIGALLAGAHALTDDDGMRQRALAVLRRMASAPPPIIDAPRAVPLGLPQTYSQKTWTPESQATVGIGEFLDLSLLGMDTMSRVLKRQDGVALAGEQIDFHVDLGCDEADVAALDGAARRVPYFGTSKDPADLSVTSKASLGDVPQPLLERWYSYEHANGRSHGWQANTVDWFEANFQRTFGSDGAISTLALIDPAGFVRQLVFSRVRSVKSVEFPFVALPRSISHQHIPRAVRRINESADAPLGWTAFALTVSHEFAETNASGDGRCVGIGLAPAEGRQMSTEESEVASEFLARHIGLVSEDADGLVVGQPAALRPATWVGPTTSWYSTTPLRAFPDERVARWQLAAQLGHRYGVEVAGLTLDRVPRIARNGRWADSGLTDGCRQWWAELTVSASIEGPLLLGSATDRGFGTFRPRSR